MPGAVVAAPFDPVGVMAGALDHAVAGPAPAPAIEVLARGDHTDEDLLLVLRAETPGPTARRAAARAVIHMPRARSRAAGSTAVSTRQIVTRSGTAPGRPSPALSSGPASAAHSAIAANDRAPARVAQTATARTGTRSYRTPRGSRGSGTCASASSSPPGTAPAGPPQESPSRWPAASTVSEDDTAGTAPGDDHGVSTTS